MPLPSLPRVSLSLLSRQKQSEEMSGEAEALTVAAAEATEEDDEIETEYDKIGRRGRGREGGDRRRVDR